MAWKTVHGLRDHPLYPIWASMKQRCINNNHPAYYRYGGRGITVCDQWLNSFATFLKDMGNRPDGYTIERVNNAEGYSPNNCVWSDRKTQARNRAGRGERMSPKARAKLLADDKERLAEARESQRIKPKDCPHCGKSFIHHGGYQEQQHCSMACYHAARTIPKPVRNCEYCGVAFTLHRRTSRKRYCSISCGALHRYSLLRGE